MADASSESVDVFELLKWQSDSHDRHFRDALSRLDQVLFFAFPVLATTATILLYYKVYAAGFAVPLVFIAVGYIAVNTTAEMLALAAFRDFTDQQLAELARRSSEMELVGGFVSWGRSAGPIRRSSIPNFLLQLLFSSLGVVGGYLCLWFAWSHDPGDRWEAIAVFVIFSILLLLGIPAGRQALGTYDAVQEAMAVETGSVADFTTPQLLIEGSHTSSFKHELRRIGLKRKSHARPQ